VENGRARFSALLGRWGLIFFFFLRDFFHEGGRRLFSGGFGRRLILRIPQFRRVLLGAGERRWSGCLFLVIGEEGIVR
jgi:hypothetical protein